jgi:Uma2 family endonuclease
MNLDPATPPEPDPESQQGQPSEGDVARNGLPFYLPPEYWPNLDDLVTEDETPVDNIFIEKQQRLLVEPLYSSWAGPGEGRPFLALSNVGLFMESRLPALVPDAMLSLDVRPGPDLQAKENRSYFVWLLGKVPDVVVEIVSDRRGGEDTIKLRDYARIGVPYYVVFDPRDQLQGGVLRVFARQGALYQPMAETLLPEIGLGLTLWQGRFEGSEGLWLRWCDKNQQVIPTGRERAERLAAQLRALGIEPAP